MWPQYDVRLVGRDCPDYYPALHLALSARPATRGMPAPAVEELLRQARERALSIDLLYGAYRTDHLAGASLAVRSPGATAMVFASDPAFRGQGAVEVGATIATLVELKKAAWRESVVLLEVLIAPEASDVAEILDQAGFSHLTRLLYLSRPAMAPLPALPLCRDLEWRSYSPQSRGEFISALEASYAQTLDCPELVGLRSTEDMLEGHRAIGEHDPRLWWVALRGGEPVGVLLLTRIPSRDCVEIVYVGVAQLARGQNVGNALVHRALKVCAEEGATNVALAVDRANAYARKMYSRWGFRQTGARDAWIASPPRAGV